MRHLNPIGIILITIVAVIALTAPYYIVKYFIERPYTKTIIIPPLIKELDDVVIKKKRPTNQSKPLINK